MKTEFGSWDRFYQLPDGTDRRYQIREYQRTGDTRFLLSREQNLATIDQMETFARAILERCAKQREELG